MNKTRVEPVYLNTITYQNRRSILGIVSSLRDAFTPRQAASQKELHCTFLKSALCVVLGATLVLFLSSVAFHLGNYISYLAHLEEELTLIDEFVTHLDILKSKAFIAHVHVTNGSALENPRNQTCHLAHTKIYSGTREIAIFSDINLCKRFNNGTHIFNLAWCDSDNFPAFDRLMWIASKLRFTAIAAQLIHLLEFYGTVHVYPVHSVKNMNRRMDSESNTLRSFKCSHNNITLMLNEIPKTVVRLEQEVESIIHTQYVGMTLLILSCLIIAIASYCVSIHSTSNALKSSPVFKRIYGKVRLKFMQIIHEKEQSEILLHQMLPASVADRLIAGQPVEAETFEEVTIYFSDIVGFNDVALSASPIQIVNLLNSVYGSV